MLWDTGQVGISELASMEQEIHVVVSSLTHPPWLLSAIYASLRFAERCLLWENLEVVAGLHSMPWVIAGDFNEVLMGEEKFGGNPISMNGALQFQECLDICRMIDIGFSGPRFTWSNCWPLSHLVQERIDRAFVNANWSAIFLEAAVLHLEKLHSNHCPIKVCFGNNREFHPPRSFQFQPMWLSHPMFPSIVKDAWHNPPSLQQALTDITIKARSWNRDQFGNLFHRKKRIQARLKGIQGSLSISPNVFLVELENKLRLEYAEVARLEKEYWAMKARILWLVEGDKNTFFYNTLALVRRRRNHILCMKDMMGNWLNGERDIA